MLSLVIPIYNEESNIPNLLVRSVESLTALSIPFEIILTDDGSSDNSLNLLREAHQKDNRIKVLSFSRNFGHQAAIFAGLSHANGDYIAVIDGDLQDPPEILSDFYEKLLEGYDVVYAIRQKRKENFLKKAAYKTYYRTLKAMSAINIPLDSGDFCMMRREVLDKVLAMPEQSLFIRGIRTWVGYNQIGLAYDRDKRFTGEPKFTFKKLMQLAINGIISFSNIPIKLLTRTGLFIIFFSILYIIYTLIKKFYFGDVPQGFTTLIIFISLFSGIQILGLGIIGEYLVRIYDETRKRPLFIVKEKLL